ncbi:hypothetical protein TNCV_2354611 [Trichonephila clavipes]|nr:hypothetical protein TNCV_2354611 [Trichonephila clavipes]
MEDNTMYGNGDAGSHSKVGCDNRTDESFPEHDTDAFSKQLAARWSTAIGVLISTSSILRRLLHGGLRERVPSYKIPPHVKPSTDAFAMGS